MTLLNWVMPRPAHPGNWDMEVIVLPDADPDQGSRFKELHNCVEFMGKRELIQVCQRLNLDNTKEARSTLQAAVLEWRDLKKRRDVTTLYLRGMPYRLLLTGGPDTGGPPTLAMGPMRVLECCDSIWKLLEQWAREDLED